MGAAHVVMGLKEVARLAQLLELSGAAGLTRTDDLTLTKRLLYQLSYSGVGEAGILPENAQAAVERTRTMISTPSVTMPSGNCGNPEIAIGPASMSVNSPVSTL